MICTRGLCGQYSVLKFSDSPYLRFLGRLYPRLCCTSRPGGSPRAAGPRFGAARQTTLGHTRAPCKFISRRFQQPPADCPLTVTEVSWIRDTAVWDYASVSLDSRRRLLDQASAASDSRSRLLGRGMACLEFRGRFGRSGLCPDFFPFGIMPRIIDRIPAARSGLFQSRFVSGSAAGCMQPIRDFRNPGFSRIRSPLCGHAAKCVAASSETAPAPRLLRIAFQIEI